MKLVNMSAEVTNKWSDKVTLTSLFLKEITNLKSYLTFPCTDPLWLK